MCLGRIRSVTLSYNRDDLLLTNKVTCDTQNDCIYSISTASLGRHLRADQVITISATCHYSKRSVLRSMAAKLLVAMQRYSEIFPKSLSTSSRPSSQCQSSGRPPLQGMNSYRKHPKSPYAGLIPSTRPHSISGPIHHSSAVQIVSNPRLISQFNLHLEAAADRLFADPVAPTMFGDLLEMIVVLRPRVATVKSMLHLGPANILSPVADVIGRRVS
jgi:hypothetical protein